MKSNGVVQVRQSDGTWIVRMNVLFIVACMALLVVVVIGANSFAGSQVGIVSLQSEIRELRELQHRTGAALAEREHPSNIEAYARERGMVLASDASYVAVDGTGVAGLSEQDR